MLFRGVPRAVGALALAACLFTPPILYGARTWSQTETVISWRPPFRAIRQLDPAAPRTVFLHQVTRRRTRWTGSAASSSGCSSISPVFAYPVPNHVYPLPYAPDASMESFVRRLADTDLANAPLIFVAWRAASTSRSSGFVASSKRVDTRRPTSFARASGCWRCGEPRPGATVRRERREAPRDDAERATACVPDRPSSWAFAVCAGAMIALLWSFEYLPLVDLPQHVAQLSYWVHHDDPAFGFGDQFRLMFSPYLVGYGLARVAGLVMPPGPAIKLVITVAVIALPWSMARLLRHVGTDRWWALLGFPLALGFSFQWGFFSWIVAVPLFLLALPSTLSYAQRPTARGAWGSRPRARRCSSRTASSCCYSWPSPALRWWRRPGRGAAR